ncbi:pentatricopeptide repeat-containing protein At4g13650 isoform X1 [Dendrobium catenatum]|uniref:pentatricopeptide repeat-containing protein At4g13650 isoform X1 n=1 Tax=Dendrobium catenatum TaxID=906689 RepID=UPI0010A055A8|nr:pentatricopeptide repeat-containing protein At4g13650 isoform X1 [Dendrobium catenatum]
MTPTSCPSISEKKKLYMPLSSCPALTLPRPSSCFFPRSIPINKPKPYSVFFKLFISNVGFGSIRHFQAAACRALCDSSDGEIEGNAGLEIAKGDAFSILNFMEQRGVRPNFHTYASVLDTFFSLRSLKGVQRVHGVIMKLGFDTQSVLSDRLFNLYYVLGDFASASKVLVDLSLRSVALWNRMIADHLRKNEKAQVISFFMNLLREFQSVDPVIFSGALRACTGNSVFWPLVQQIHGKIIRIGLTADPIVCNPLIDLYSKNKSIDSAILVFDEMCSKDNVSWVAMMSGLSQNGLGKEACNLYFQMHQSGIIPTPYVLSSILSACTKTELFDQGMQIHAQSLKWGFCAETFVGNALISFYSRSRSLESAEKVFYEMSNRDGVTYNSMISGYGMFGNSERAICAFKEMESSGFKPDSVTIASLLCACACIGAIQKGKQLHAYVLKAGLSSDYIIEGSLLDLYVKCADIDTSRQLFDSTKKENVVLWNVMLVAYGQMGDLSESFNLFSEMLVAGLEANQYTYPSILRTCTYYGELDLGEQIHSMTIKTGFQMNIFVCSVLIDMYSKCGVLERARQILNRQTEKDVVSWTAMIAGYAQHEHYVEALKTFEEMKFHGIKPDNIGLSSAISACAGLKAVSQGLQIHGQACVLGYSTDLSIGNALVNLYARCGMIMEAYSAFEANEVRDDVSWNALISGFGQSGHYEEALVVYKQMSQKDIKANLFTYGSAVSSSANIADIKLGNQIHSKMIKTGYDMEIEAANSLVSLYAKCGSIGDAKLVFNKMPERNEISWNAIITAYSQHGRGKEALQLFEHMKEEGLKPNHVTFIAVLTACSHVGLVTEGLNHFDSISKEHGLVPKPEHFVCVVDLLGRAGQLNRARRFIDSMPVTPDSMIWRSLLGACTIHKNIEVGEFAGHRLLELEPHDSATYVLLSNLYAVTRKWECRDRMRQVMKDRGVKKEPGLSWIEVKNEIHSFFVGDRLHSLAEAIYEHLEELNKRAVDIGYKQDKYCLLQEIEQEQKDPTAWIHSEKLAVSFGHMKLPPEVPIRVIKNIRVCSDCHNWMKFISRVVGRVIILRDSYRFHHFEAGDCSCGDYW